MEERILHLEDPSQTSIAGHTQNRCARRADWIKVDHVVAGFRHLTMTPRIDRLSDVRFVEMKPQTWQRGG
jgi:hypothetical protein